MKGFLRISLPVLLSCGLALSCNAAEAVTRELPSIAITRNDLSSRSLPNDSVESLLRDLSNLESLESSLPILQRTESDRDSSYTHNWKYEDWDRHQVRSFFRYKRHLTTWYGSTTALAVYPTVIALSCWALLIFFVSIRFEPFGKFLSQASFTKGVVSYGGPISLLLALRTNRSLNRLFEARSMFGKYIRASTSLASLVATYVGPKHRCTALLMGRYLAVYGWCMKGFFRRESDVTLLEAMLPPLEAQWILRQQLTNGMDTPSCIHTRLRSLLASVIQDVPLSAANAMEDRLSVLESSLGVNKRLVGSPIPPTYTRHTSRVLCLYLGLLPMALVGTSDGRKDVSFVLSFLATIGATAYVFVGIDEIGVEIENPFPLIPMQALAKVIQKSVANHIRILDDLPPNLSVARP